MTNELPFVHQALQELEVQVSTQSILSAFDGGKATLSDIFTGKEQQLSVASVVIVGLRLPSDSLYLQLMDRQEEVKDAGIKSVDRIGDVLAPGALVHAVYSGHAYARQLDADNSDLYLRDIPVAIHPPGPVI